MLDSIYIHIIYIYIYKCCHNIIYQQIPIIKAINLMKILELCEFPIYFKFEIINKRMAGIFVIF